MLKTFSITDIGKTRELNQDFVFTSEEPVGNLPNLFIVADGMGGHNAGDYASRYTVETLIHEISVSEDRNPIDVIKNAIGVANEHIRTKAQEDVHLSGMGTTLVVATIYDDLLQVANVGDSRLYIVNDEEIKQITRDHSLVEEMIRMGGLERKDARLHPDKNIITRAIGAADSVKVDFFSVRLQEGDKILMCTDGLTNMVEDEEIRILMEGARDIVESAQSLVDAANENGGQDNIGVIIIEEDRA